MILRATIGCRCVCRVFFFTLFFLEIFPLLFTKYFFFIPLYLSMALGQPNLGRIYFFFYLWLVLVEGSHELLAILSLILHINLDLGGWNLS